MLVLYWPPWNTSRSKPLIWFLFHSYLPYFFSCSLWTGRTDFTRNWYGWYLTLRFIFQTLRAGARLSLFMYTVTIRFKRCRVHGWSWWNYIASFKTASLLIFSQHFPLRKNFSSLLNPSLRKRILHFDKRKKNKQKEGLFCRAESQLILCLLDYFHLCWLAYVC